MLRCAQRADRRSAFPARRVTKEKSDTPSRCAMRSGADRRSAFPARRVTKEKSDTPSRCAMRSGADRRSAFPARRLVKERSDPPPRCAARSGADRRSAFPVLRVVKARSDPSLLRCAQRADRRSAFPARRVVKARSDPSLLRYAQRAGPHRENWPEVGVPSRPRAFSQSATGVPKKQWQRTSGSLPAISGESVKGGYPLSQSVTTNRNSPQCAEGAQGSFDCRREAPGGSEAGLTVRHAPIHKLIRGCAPLPDRLVGRAGAQRRAAPSGPLGLGAGGRN